MTKAKDNKHTKNKEKALKKARKLAKINTLYIKFDI
jgi:hypothetical protein